MSMLWVSLCLAMSGLLQTQAVDIPDIADFEPEQMGGLWYAVAAGSDCEQFMQMKPAMRMAKIQINAHEDGDLEVAVAFPMEDQCITRNMHYTMIAPGQYTESDGQNRIKFVEAVYTEFAMEYSERVDINGERCTMIQLFARNPSVPPQAIPHFQGLMNKAELQMNNMAMLMKGMDCDPAEA